MQQETNTTPKLSYQAEYIIKAAIIRRLDDIKEMVKNCTEQMDKSIDDADKEYWQNSLNFWNERADDLTKAKEEFYNFMLR
jgi:hypothetical protein